MSLDLMIGIRRSSEYFADLIIVYITILKNIDPVTTRVARVAQDDYEK